MSTQMEVVPSVREGSRWRHGAPTADEVATWFKEQPLHDGMQHQPYMGGVVVIGQNEKVKKTLLRPSDGVPYVEEVEEAVFTPYVKVETRISYFRDYVAANPDWRATVLPVPVKVIDNPTSAYFNAHLPEGYSIHAIRDNQEVTYYICYTVEIAVWEAQGYADRLAGKAAAPVMQAVGTKQVPMKRRYPDDNCMMKAQTGAVGRSLGFLGMLVVGTGVATVEDVLESASADYAQPSAAAELPPVVDREGAPVAQAPPAAPVAAQAPEAAVPDQTPPEGEDEALRKQALALQAEMERDFPDTWQAYREWYASRDFGRLADLSGPALKGAVTKLERDLDAAKNPKPPSAS